MRGSRRPSQGLSPYPLPSLPSHALAPVALRGRFLPPSPRFLPKSESKRVRATQTIQYK